MLERWFGKKKEETKPGVGGTAHIDGSFEDPRINSSTDVVDEKFAEGDGRQFKKDVTTRTWDIDESKHDSIGTKVGNERQKQKLTDLHSDWKEKGVFDTPLSKEEASEEILDVMEQEEDTKTIREMYDFGDEEYKDAA